jgi:cell division protein FtsB
MTDVRIKADENGQPDAPSLATVNKKIEAFVEILTAAFQKQHERIRTLEQEVEKLKKSKNG